MTYLMNGKTFREEWLMCDFHIHTSMSDGKLPLREVVDLYGQKDFDAICITDHCFDKITLQVNGSNTIRPEAFQDYLRALWKEGQRAWNKYRLLLIPGIELTNEHKKYHILVIDIKEFIDPSLPVEEIIQHVREQDALAIACHPHHKAFEGPQLYMHLWDNHKKYANLFDAWEIANRDDLFNVVGLKKFNYVANSDFHQPAHIYSWKTLVRTEKNVNAIKLAIKENKDVALFLYRDNKPQLRQQIAHQHSKSGIICEPLPFSDF